MLKNLFLLFIFAIVFISLSFSQSHEPFTGASSTDISSTQKWVKPGGIFGATTSLGRDGSGLGYAKFENDSAGRGGYLIWDSAVGTSGEAYYVIKQLSGSVNTRNVFLFRDDNTSFANGSGTVVYTQEMSGDDYVVLRYYSMNEGVAWINAGYPEGAYSPTGMGTLTIQKPLVVGDTIFLRFWDNPGTADDRFTAGIRHAAGGAIDSISFLVDVLTGSTLTAVRSQMLTAGRFGLGANVRSTPEKFDDFHVITPGTAAPPPPPAATKDTLPPEVINAYASPTSTIVGGDIAFTGVFRDLDYGIKQAIAETCSSPTFASGIGTFDQTNINLGTPVLSKTWTTKTMTRAGVSTVYMRFRIQQDSINSFTYWGKAVWDTSNIISAIWINPIGGDTAQILKGTYITTWDTYMGSGTDGNSGIMPADSIPFDAFDYFITFATGFNSSTSLITNNWVSSRRKALNDKYHAHGKPVLLCLGNTETPFILYAFPDAGTRTTSIKFLMSYVIDSLKYDGLDINCETDGVTGTFDTALYTVWIKQLYDSLQTRTNSYTRTGKPMLTAAAQSGARQGEMFARIDEYFDMIHLMSYDKMDDWNAMVFHESGLFSYLYPGGTTNVALSNTFGGVCNGNPNYMQTAQHFYRTQVARPGAIGKKYALMIDIDGVGYRGGNFGDGEGPIWPRRAWHNWVAPDDTCGSGMPTMFTVRATGNEGNGGTSDWKFYNLYNPSTYYQYFKNSLHWDDTTKNPFLVLNKAGSANDEYISFVASPEKDSSVYWLKKLANQEGAGGVCLWTYGESYLGSQSYNFPSGTYPNIDRNWLATAFRKYFQGDTIPTKLAPPALVFPADGASSGISVTTPIYWRQVTGATKYWLVVDDSSTFNGTWILSDSSFVTQTDTVNSAMPTLSNGKSYYWRVATKYVNGFGQFSSPFSFTTVAIAPPTPTLISPADAATGQAPVITLSWNTVSTATAYNVQIDSVNSSFANLITDVTTSTTYFVKNLPVNPKTYHWRVRASHPGGFSSFTGSRSFTTIAAVPNIPALVSPQDGIGYIDSNYVTFNWNPSSGALTYRIQIAQAPAFTALVKDTTTSLTSYTLADLNGYTYYYWRVLATNASGSSIYSPYWTFQTTAPPVVIAGANAQIPLWWSIVKGGWTWNQIPSFLAMSKGDSNLLLVPPPLSNSYVNYNTYGYKDSAGNVTKFGGGGGGGTNGAMTGQDISDSLASQAVFGLKLVQSEIYDGLYFKSDIGGVGVGTTVRSSNRSGNIDINLPPIPGTLATTEGSTIHATNLSSDAAIPATSGGVGYTPAEIKAIVGNVPLILGFNPSVTNSWEWYTEAGFKSTFNISSSGSAPNGRTIVDSLNTNSATPDTITKSLTFEGDTLAFKRAGAAVEGIITNNSSAGILSIRAIGSSAKVSITNSNGSGASMGDKVPLDAFQGAGVGSTTGSVAAFRTVVTDEDPMELIVQGKGVTTDGSTYVTLRSVQLDDSTVNLLGFTLPDSATYLIEATFVASWFAGSTGDIASGGATQLSGTFRQANSTTVTPIGTVSTDHNHWTAAINTAVAEFNINGKWVEARVKGAANTSLRWAVTLHIFWMGPY